jgi:tetratricopeptide (TPR) repeat protein
MERALPISIHGTFPDSSREAAASAFAAASWNVRKSGWSEIEVRSEVGELCLESDAPTLVHGIVDDASAVDGVMDSSAGRVHTLRLSKIERWTMLRSSVVFAGLALCWLAGCHSQPQPKAEQPRHALPLLVPDEPTEFRGEPKPKPEPPSAAMKALFESKAFSADPKKPETLLPAIRALDDFLQAEPKSADFYLMRATLRCLSGADPQLVFHDISASIANRRTARSQTPFATLREHYVLRAKLEFDLEQYDEAIRDLSNAIGEDYSSASNIFDDGEVKPSNKPKPCQWTRPDLRVLFEKRGSDSRAVLFQTLYDIHFLAWNLDGDYTSILKSLERVSDLAPSSPLPDYLIGNLYSGRLGGMMSTASAQCIDFVKPRTKECLALDELHRAGLIAFTRAIARDPAFAPAYAARANTLYGLKEYRQAVRDYDRAIELLPPASAQRRGLYNDRGMSKEFAGDVREAVDDYTHSINLGCDDGSCGSYKNRARAYSKLGEYQKAIEDWSTSIQHVMSYQAFGIRIDSFRALYPEYDTISDPVLAERLRVLFNPQLSYEIFSKEFLVEAKREPTFVLVDFYLQRGDAYAKLKQPDRAEREYQRVLKVFPQFAEPYFTVVNGKPVRNQVEVGE